jgi:hypothetical protein
MTTTPVVVPPIVNQPIPQPTVIVVPSAPAPVPVAAVPVPSRSLLASCELAYNRVPNDCKALLDDATLDFKRNNAGELIVVADPLTGKVRANNVREYLIASGVDAGTSGLN